MIPKMGDRSLDDETDRGFDYVLRDQLKRHCLEKNLYLDCSGMNAKHDLIIDLITYSSMGDFKQALKSAEVFEHDAALFGEHDVVGITNKPEEKSHDAWVVEKLFHQNKASFRTHGS